MFFLLQKYEQGEYFVAKKITRQQTMGNILVTERSLMCATILFEFLHDHLRGIAFRHLEELFIVFDE